MGLFFITMIFKDREDAARHLAKKLSACTNNSDVIVIALPRGGVVLGRIIADELHAPLDIIVPRKIGAPDNEEYAIGALTEQGHVTWNEEEKKRYAKKDLDIIVAKEIQEAKRRLIVYRKNLPPRNLKDKIVILVDDGVATGYTIRAALQTARAEQPKKIIIAITGGPNDTIELLKHEADNVVFLTIPALFLAVGNLYHVFPQVEDDIVIRLLHPT